MKKVTLFLLALLMLTGFGCKSKESAPADVVDVLDIASTAPVPQSTGDASGEMIISTSSGAAVSVVSTLACVYDGAQGTTLYGAVEYVNSGSVAVVLTDANFTFSGGGANVAESFVPVFAEYDVVEPGEHSYAAFFKADSTIPAGTEVTLSAVLTCVQAQQSRRSLEISDVFLADNYPGFTTMSGSIVNKNADACSMNMSYVGFYDSADKLLGVWYFSKNARLESDDIKTFVVHMKELPVSELASRAVRIETVSFGFDL